MKSLPLLCIGWACLAAHARADYLLGPFDAPGMTEEPVAVVLDVSNIPPGTYAGFELTVTAAFSYRDVRWRLMTPGLIVPLADPGVSPDSLQDPLPPTQTWAGTFTQTYQGGQPLTFIAWMDQQGESLDWTNITITLSSGEVPPATPPFAADVGAIVSPGFTLMSELNSNGVNWVRFNVPTDVTTAGCRSLRIDTIGSILIGGIYQHGNDPELALYTVDGLLLSAHDDIDQYFGNLHAALVFGVDEGVPVPSSGDLSAGTYFLAIAGFDAHFGWSHFETTRDSGVTGEYRINFRVDQVAIDCNLNGNADACEIAAGTSVDLNGNGVPDECDDDDGDGIANGADACPNSPPGAPINPSGGPMGDADDDCAVMLSDYQLMHPCLEQSGPSAALPEGDCRDVFDFDNDGDVDLADFAAVHAALSL